MGKNKNEEKRYHLMAAMTDVMLQASGMDIRAPKKLREYAVEGLELQNDPEWIFIDADLDQIQDPEKKLNIIRGLILTHLTPSDMMSLTKVIHAGVEGIIRYLSAHPEEKGKILDPEELLNLIKQKEEENRKRKEKEDAEDQDEEDEEDDDLRLRIIWGYL